MADRSFKTLGGSQTRGVTCIRAKWTFDGSGTITSGQQQDGIFIGATYNDGVSTGTQAFYLGRFDSQPYAASVLVPHTHQNDFYSDILGIEMTFKSDSDPVASERIGFEISGTTYVSALSPGVTFAPVFALKYISLDDGTAAAASDLAGTTVHMTVWLKNSADD